MTLEEDEMANSQGFFAFNFGAIVRDFYGAIGIIVFLLIALLADSTIPEISGRDRYVAQIESELKKIEENPSSAEADLTQTDAKDLRYRMAILERLIQIGVDNGEETLSAMRLRADSPNGRRESNVLSPIIDPRIYLARFGSDFLPALAIVACAALGAGVASVREGGGLSMRSLLLGISSGFLVFLIVRGGAHVFLLGECSAFPQFNPFTYGLLGFVAGSFTARMYELL